MSVQNLMYHLENVLSQFKIPKADFGSSSFPQICWADVI